jgi:polyferredoxin
MERGRIESIIGLLIIILFFLIVPLVGLFIWNLIIVTAIEICNPLTYLDILLLWIFVLVVIYLYRLIFIRDDCDFDIDLEEIHNDNNEIYS